MISADIEKLKIFINDNHFNTYRLRSEDQPEFTGGELLKADLIFSELLVNEFPDSIFLRDGCSVVMIDRPVQISCKMMLTPPVGEIMVTNQPFSYRGRSKKVYRIIAEYFSL